MPKSQRCCIFVPVLINVVLHLVTGYRSISGSSGESATLFRGISFNSHNIAFTLYKNYDDYVILLAMWSKHNSDPVKETYEDGYGKKLSLENGTIRIHNLSKSDEGKYVLHPALGVWSIEIEVHLVILVAPPKQCTPNIKRAKNTLVASLDDEDCFNSIAHVSWYKICASNRSRSVRKLNNTWRQKGTTKSMIYVGEEADTYCACTEGSDMNCVRTFDRFDLCSCFKIEKENILATLPRRPEITTWSELSDLTKRTTDIHAERLELPELSIIALSIIPVLAIVAVIVTSIILYRRWKVGNPDPSKDQSTGQTQSLTDKAPSPYRNQELSLETEPSMTTTSSSEAPSPSRNEESSERKEISSQWYSILNTKIEEPVTRIE